MENDIKKEPLQMPHDLLVDIHEKSYENKNQTSYNSAIKNMKFTVPQGQFCCLVGPSGCGKTTLLNIILGFSNVNNFSCCSPG